jgi:hypothetical protein
MTLPPLPVAGGAKNKHKNIKFTLGHRVCISEIANSGSEKKNTLITFIYEL